MSVLRRIEAWWHRLRIGHEPVWDEMFWIGHDRWCEVCFERRAEAVRAKGWGQ